jgi:DNA processing protein
MTYSSQSLGFIALSYLKGIGPAFVKKVSTKSLFANDNIAKELIDLLAANNKIYNAPDITDALENAKDVLFTCDKENIVTIPLTSEDYPKALFELADPPAVLYCKGNIKLFNSNIVSIIGSRKPNETGVRISERVGQFFLSQNWSICNGLAEGVDNCSIKISGEMQEGIIGVLAGGLNFNSTKTLLKSTAENARLVLETNGLLVSEVKPNVKEDTFSVVKSCRIQAGLSKGLIIIQSSIDGGSKFATKAFCRTGRPLGVIHPIAQDYDLPSYEANKMIIEARQEGLSKFIGLAESKIETNSIFVIQNRSQYQGFVKLMSENTKYIEKQKPTLFD